MPLKTRHRKKTPFTEGKGEEKGSRRVPMGAVLFGDEDHPMFRQAGPGRPQTWYKTATLMDEIVRRIESGRSLKKISQDEDMPSLSIIKRWRTEDIEFNDRIDHALQRRPPIERPGALQYDKSIGDAIVQALLDGGRLTTICKAEDMPCFSTVQRWRHRVPGFDRAIVDAMFHGEYKGGPGLTD